MYTKELGDEIWTVEYKVGSCLHLSLFKVQERVNLSKELSREVPRARLPNFHKAH